MEAFGAQGLISCRYCSGKAGQRGLPQDFDLLQSVTKQASNAQVWQTTPKLDTV